MQSLMKSKSEVNRFWYEKDTPYDHLYYTALDAHYKAIERKRKRTIEDHTEFRVTRPSNQVGVFS